MSACEGEGGSSSNNSPDTSVGASVSGVVVTNNLATEKALRVGTSVQVVDDLSNATSGATPIVGAQVRLTDREGNLQAETVTDDNGSFIFNGLTITHAVIEVRQAPNSSDPDYKTSLTLVREKSIAVGKSYSINRQTAATTAAGLASESALVACSQNPLPAKTLVFSTFGNVNTGELNLEQAYQINDDDDEWFCLIDETMTSLWAHEVTYVFINAQTGEVTTRSEHWLPSINFIQIWDYQHDLFAFDQDVFLNDDFVSTGDLPDTLDVVISSDVVKAPTDEFISATLSSVAQLRQFFEGINALQIPDEDKFALLWGGSPESWFFRDIILMRAWAIANGIPASNIQSVVFGSQLEAIQTLDLTSPVTESQAVVRRLAETIQARRDAGGRPALFVYSIAHGNANGQILIVDNAVDGIGRHYFPSIFGNQLMIPVDVLLPIHQIPACKIRWVLTSCFGATALQRVITAFSSTDQDVQLITASGYGKARGWSLSNEISRSYNESFDDLSELIFVNASIINFLSDIDASSIGSKMAKQWHNGGATLDSEFELTFSGNFFDTLASVSSLDETIALDDGTSRNNDRVFWDPERPDPCETQPFFCGDGNTDSGEQCDDGNNTDGDGCNRNCELETGISPPDISYRVTPLSVSVIHKFNVDDCPQLIGTITIENTGDAVHDYQIAINDPIIAVTPMNISAAPGESVQINLTFLCDPLGASGTLTISGTTSDGTILDITTLPVNVSVSKE